MEVLTTVTLSKKVSNSDYLCDTFRSPFMMSIRFPLRLLRILTLCAFLALSLCPAPAQNLSGSWKGTARLDETPLTLIFHIAPIGSTWQGTFDCPNQNAFDLTISSIRLSTADSVAINLPTINASFKGKMKRRSIKGIFSQGDLSTSLTLKKLSPSKSKKRATQ